jgi:stage II sporulation protein R
MKKTFAVLFVFFVCIFFINSYFEGTQAALGDGLIRFHVLANSNLDHDQKLKLKVRDRIINEMSSLFDSHCNADFARNAIINNLESIKSIATDEVRKNGYDYSVNVSLGQSEFPHREYGDIVLPAGTYEALRVEIGEAKGQNWWCVLFPPLCFVESGCIGYNSEAGEEIKKSVGDKYSELVDKNSPAVQLSMFDTPQNEKVKLVEEKVISIRSKFGKNSIKRASSINNHAKPSSPGFYKR